MRPWLVLVVIGLVPTVLAAETMGEAALASVRGADGCESRPLDRYPLPEALSSTVVARVENAGDPVDLRICMFDALGEKRLDVTLPFAARESRDVAIPVPPGVYWFHAEGISEVGTASASGNLDTRWCFSRAAEMTVGFEFTGRGTGARAEGGGCTTSTLALGGVGIMLTSLGAILAKAPHLGAFVLYSRLARPRLLDSELRAKLHDLVEREPGIHSRELGRALSAADGQVAHHLGVLAREGLVTSLGLPGFRHWFLTGRFSQAQMRAFATLRDPTRRRPYAAVVAAPGASLSDVRASAGVSLAQASRAAKALERAGLIQRTVVGRELTLQARIDALS